MWGRQLRTTGEPASAIILAAGRGRRLGPLTSAIPKCLVEVGGRSILERLLDQLQLFGFRRAAVVAGYRREQVASVVEAARIDTRIVVNSRYEITGTAYSLALGLGLQALGGPLLIIEGDILFDQAILASLLARDDAVATVVDSSSRLDGSKLVVDENGRVRSWRHARDGGGGIGHKAVNLTIVRDPQARRALAAAAQQVVELDPAAPAERAFDCLCRAQRVGSVDANDGVWMEIDDRSDLAAAERMFGVPVDQDR